MRKAERLLHGLNEHNELGSGLQTPTAKQIYTKEQTKKLKLMQMWRDKQGTRDMHSHTHEQTQEGNDEQEQEDYRRQ